MTDPNSAPAPTVAAAAAQAPVVNDPTLTSISTHLGAVVAGAAAGFLAHKCGLDGTTAKFVGGQLGDTASLAIAAFATTAFHWGQAYYAKHFAK